MKKIRHIILLFIIIISAIFFIRGTLKRSKLIKTEKEKTRVLEEKIKEQKEIKNKLELEIKELDTNENVEKFARDELNMTNSDERIYKFVDDEGDSNKNGENK